MNTENEIGRVIALKAREYLGNPANKYSGPRNGMSQIEGFDCSGFITRVLQDVGITVDIRHCNEYFDKFGVSVHFGLHRAGDLVFFSRDGITPTHMGIVTQHNRYIHSPGKAGTCIDEVELKASVIRSRSEYARYLKNPIGIKRVTAELGRWRICNLPTSIFHLYMRIASDSRPDRRYLNMLLHALNRLEDTDPSKKVIEEWLKSTLEKSPD